MPVITPAVTRAFVDNVTLAAAPARARLEDQPPVELKDVEAQTLVVGSGLVVAGQNVPAQTREDLVNCTLFAQLAATGTVGDESRVVDWYDAYFKTLTALGWAQSDRQFEEYEFDGKKAEAHKAMLDILAVLLGPQAAAITVINAAIKGLQSLADNSPWITLFERESKSGKSARFQVATAQLDASGLLQTALVAFHLKATSKMTQVLFFKFASSETRLKYAAGKATIFEAALASQRHAIAARLAAYRAEYVGQVKFPPAGAGAPVTAAAPAGARKGAKKPAAPSLDAAAIVKLLLK